MIFKGPEMAGFKTFVIAFDRPGTCGIFTFSEDQVFFGGKGSKKEYIYSMNPN
jgi:hypothetical protein